MIVSPVFAGRKYAVLGLARSGLATVRTLLASGATVTAWDQSEQARNACLTGDRLSLSDFLEAGLAGHDGVVVSPGVPLNRHPIRAKAAAAGVPIIGDIELFARARPTLPPHRVVGITGTNGKSTTTALVHHICRTAGLPSTMAGNIGAPILGQEPLAAGGVYVLELSSYQLDLTRSLDCDAAVLLNITPDHLDRYDGKLDAYAASKLRLFSMQSAGRHAVVTENGFVGDRPIGELVDEALQGRSPDLPWPSVGNMTDRGAAVASGAAWWNGVAFARQADWPSLQGPHNAQNAVAAISVAAGALGIGVEVIAEGLRTYAGLPHRMERVGERDGVVFVNDSKATNPDSTAPALAAFDRIHWILGGLAKTGDLGPCEDQLGHVRAAYTIGEAGPMFARLLEGKVPVRQCEMLVEAVACASRAAVPGDVVLLSPACASFDQFRDYEARGDVFRAAVEALA